MSTTSPDPAAPMLVVGATGYLGSQVVDELLAWQERARAGPPLHRRNQVGSSGCAEYVSDTARQTEVFGQPPTAEDAIKRLAEQLHANG
jgi:nucleoside-diphosphate-sugar epimerase